MSGEVSIDLVEIPERSDFPCWNCGRACVTYPRAGFATQHSLPVCSVWDSIQAKKDDVERFLIKCGFHLLAEPEGEA